MDLEVRGEQQAGGGSDEGLVQGRSIDAERESVRTVADKILIAALTKLVAVIPTTRPAQGIAGKLRKQFGIGTLIAGEVHFSQDDLAKTQRLLQAVIAGDRQAVSAMLVPHANWTMVGGSQKPRSPSQRFRLNWNFPSIAILPLYLDLPVAYMATQPDAAAELAPEVWVACDSMAMLRNVKAFPWVSQQIAGRRAVAIYVGDRGVGFPKAKAKAALRLHPVPVLAAITYSPEGMASVAGISCLERICLPEMDRVMSQHSTITAQRFEKQVTEWGDLLDALQSEPFRSLWAEMRSVGHAFRLSDIAK